MDDRFDNIIFTILNNAECVRCLLKRKVMGDHPSHIDLSCFD